MTIQPLTHTKAGRAVLFKYSRDRPCCLGQDRHYHHLWLKSAEASARATRSAKCSRPPRTRWSSPKEAARKAVRTRIRSWYHMAAMQRYPAAQVGLARNTFLAKVSHRITPRHSSGLLSPMRVDQKPLPNMMRVMEQTATPVQVAQAQKLASQWWPLCQEIAA